MQAACCHKDSLYMVAGASDIADEIVAVCQQDQSSRFIPHQV